MSCVHHGSYVEMKADEVLALAKACQDREEARRQAEWERLTAWAQQSWWRRFMYGSSVAQVKSWANEHFWVPPKGFSTILIFTTDAEYAARKFICLGLHAKGLPVHVSVEDLDLLTPPLKKDTTP